MNYGTVLYCLRLIQNDGNSATNKQLKTSKAVGNPVEDMMYLQNISCVFLKVNGFTRRELASPGMAEESNFFENSRF